MNKLLIAAALAVSVAAYADDTKPVGGTTKTTPSTTTTSPSTTTPSTISTDDTFSEAKVLNKLHHANKLHQEMGQLVQTRGGTEKIRKFGDKLVKDHQKLDKDVLSYAKSKKITLEESETLGAAAPMGTPGSMGDTTGGKIDESGTGASASSDMYGQGSPGGSSATNRSGSQMGTTTPNSYNEPGTGGPGSAYEKSGSTTASRSGSNVPPSESGVPPAKTDESGTAKAGGVTDTNVPPSGSMATADDARAKFDQLKNLQGAEFDSQFLSNVIDNADRSISKLQTWKGQGDKKLDTLIDRSVKMFQDHSKEAQKLQQRTPAA